VTTSPGPRARDRPARACVHSYYFTDAGPSLVTPTTVTVYELFSASVLVAGDVHDLHTAQEILLGLLARRLLSVSPHLRSRNPLE